MKILIFVFSLIISAILLFTYVKISKPDIRPEEIKQETQKPPAKKRDFLISFKDNYNFPARELFMKIDFKEYKNVILYKVVINANDEYAVFNIKTILENENIAYSMLEKKKTEIYILFKSLSQAERVIKLFKNYNFDVTIKKIIKRI